jgi:hypothetical protein
MILLYRGTSYYIEDGIYKNAYLKRPRVPKNTPSYIHEAADNWFKNNFGICARSQTIFCTPCREYASSHFESGGSLLEISLIGDTNKIIYSDEVSDFLDLIPKEAFDIKRDYIFDIAEKLSLVNYKLVKNINEIPSSFIGEIMLFCEQYKVKNID